jgi:AraC-like DNA-binding protein
MLWSRQSCRGLCYFLIFVAFSMVFNLAEELGGLKEFYHVTPVFMLGIGPFFYFFVYQFVYPDKKIDRKLIVHLLPMLTALAFTQFPQLLVVLGSSSQLLYAYISVNLVFAYHKASFDVRSDADSLQLNWLINILVLFVLLGVLDLFRLNLQYFISGSVNFVGQLFNNTSALLLFSYLIFKAIKQTVLVDGSNVFEVLEYSVEEENNENNKKEEEIARAIFISLEQIIVENSLHHKARLTLSDLVDETGLNSRDISRAINLIGGVSFCDFINKLRVRDIKKHLAHRLELEVSLLDLAYQFGFNSKSSFNSVFKRELGMTPTQYIKSLPD